VDNTLEFAAVLGQFFDASPFSISQLAMLSGVPKPTIANWLQGRVAKPHGWQGIARVCSKLDLPEAQATEVLQAAGHPSVSELLAHAVSDEDIESLSRWSESARMRQENAPFQAIADFPHFVGRVDNLEVLKKVLRAGKHVTPYVLEGMPGVGKTALAAHLAYELRLYFLDGVLWARLDTSDTMSILSAFANAYGSDVSKYPDVDSRSQVVREILASKRVLIILDNAQRSEQVLPLLPPTGACAVIITTRHRGLSVSRGARRFHVEVFDREKAEALALFAKILGQERGRTERACLLEIADLLGHLPLAVDIAASRLANEPNWSTSRFLDLMKVEKSRLGNLVYEDLSVRTSFNLSFGALEPEMRQMYASLGALCGSDFGTDAVAYITRSTREEAEAKLRVLYSLSLIQQARPGRYQLHPLLCTYAREQLSDAAVPERMVEFFVQYAESYKSDLPKIGQELDGILGALQAAQDLKMPRLQVRGTTAVFRFLEIGGLYDKAEFILQQAQPVAVASGDTAGEAKVLLNLGRLATRRGDLARGQEYWQQALAAATAANDRETMSAALGNLGIAAYNLGETEESEGFFQRSLARLYPNGYGYYI
jgi:tetratricopeptide (TPR) repeat protein/transcriptional regulator with XRE-family HTH domain